MQKYTQKLKEITVICLIVLMIMPYGLLVQPQKVEAVGFFTGLDLIQDVKELPLDLVASFAKGIIIAAITESIINWINSGFDGNPSFIDNPEAFYTDVANEVTGVFIDQLGLGFMCEPFSLQIQIALATPDYFRERAQCTVLDVIDNYDAFMDDFSQGGWAGWISVTQNPQNNPYGAYLIASAELEQRKADAEQEARDDLAQGQGYRSSKKCVEYDTLSGEDCTYQDGICVPNENPRCLRYEVQTPGITIKTQLEESIGTSLAQLEMSDEITDAVAAIIMALINKVVTDGVRGLTEKQGDSYQSTWGQSIDEETGLSAIEEDSGNLQQTIESAIDVQEAIKDKIGDEEIVVIDRILICYEEQLTFITDRYHKESIDKRVAQLGDLKLTRVAAEANIETLNAIDSQLATTTTIQGLSDNWKKYNRYEKERRGGDLMGSILEDVNIGEMVEKFIPDNEQIIDMVVESIKGSLDFGVSGGGLIPGGGGLFKLPTVSPYAFMNSSKSSLLAVETGSGYTYYDLGYRTHEACSTKLTGFQLRGCLADILEGSLGANGTIEVDECRDDNTFFSNDYTQCLIKAAKRNGLSGSSEPVNTNPGEGAGDGGGIYGNSSNTPSPSSGFIKELLDEEADCKANLDTLREGGGIGWGSGSPGSGSRPTNPGGGRGEDWPGWANTPVTQCGNDRGCLRWWLQNSSEGPHLSHDQVGRACQGNEDNVIYPDYNCNFNNSQVAECMLTLYYDPGYTCPR